MTKEELTCLRALCDAATEYIKENQPTCGCWQEEFCDAHTSLGYDGIEALPALLDEVSSLQSEVERLNLEVEMLRQYGNKDCTAMADEAIKETLK